MLKYIYKIIILSVIFITSLIYFSKNIKEVVFVYDKTTVMEDATFPLITIQSGEEEINLLHGYSSNLNANMVRELVTPLGTDQAFDVIIRQDDYIIKKMNYEIREFSNNALLDEGAVSVFEEKEEVKKARIKFDASLAIGKEYAVKITLITSESKKMYYYQRVKIYEGTHLKDTLKFIKKFHKAIKSKDTVGEVTQYLEPKGGADNTSLSYVNINSSIDLVCWGKLKPKFLTEAVPSVIEIYPDIALVQLEYYIEAKIAGTKEQFQVKEFYRVRYGTDRMYLLNYERYMEAGFNPELASVSKSQLKLGISSDYEVPYMASVDQNRIAFVRNRELWFYNLEKNEMTKVFSFAQKNTDYIRDRYGQHDIQILSMDPEGNLDFVVYGYMNRGQYEGKVGIILYQFLRAENRIEERVFIPADESYQTLKENFGKLAYMNIGDVFFFHMQNNLYAYNLITHKITNLASNIGKEQIVVLKDINYVAWQDNSDLTRAENICMMNMETGKIQKISTKKGYHICLLDKIDTNIIYGFVKKDNITVGIDGRVVAPLSAVEIANVDKKILKSYDKSGYLVSDIKVRDNVVELIRVKKKKEDGKVTFVPTDQDYIMNQVRGGVSQVNVVTRSTDQALTELYLTLPAAFVMEKQPIVQTTVNTVITEDPTVRLPLIEEKPLYYYAYVRGEIAGAYEEAADAIATAREKIGVVLNNRNQLVWERGIKLNQNTIEKIRNMDEISSGGTVKSCLKLLLSYQGAQVEDSKLSVKEKSAYDILLENSRFTPVRLTGATLDDVLYFVSSGRPVIAMVDGEKAVLIFGYDAYNISVVDPKSNQTKKLGLQESADMFENAGNVFVSYLD